MKRNSDFLGKMCQEELGHGRNKKWSCSVINSRQLKCEKRAVEVYETSFCTLTICIGIILQAFNVNSRLKNEKSRIAFDFSLGYR